MINKNQAGQAKLLPQLHLRTLVAAACAVAGLALSTQASATVVFGSAGDVAWNSPAVIRNGSAHAVDTADGRVMRLVDTVTGQAGSAFFNNPYVLGANSDFEASFTFRITPADTGGVRSDGFTFVIARSPTALGTGGGDLGYGGILPSVALEFDIHQNGGWDSNDSHIGVLKNGNVTEHLAQTATAMRMDNGDKWRAVVRYLGQGDALTVQLTDLDEPTLPISSLFYKIDIPNIIGCGSAGCFDSYFGFTAGTGAGFANHDIIGWELTVPEPGVVPLVGLGLSLLGFLSSSGNRRQLQRQKAQL